MIPQEARDLIKRREVLSLKAFLCPAGHWTIGWGHTNDVHSGDIITDERAQELFDEDIHDAEEAVMAHVDVPLTPNQFGALVCLIFNIGRGAFATSALAMKLNSGDYYGAANEFGRWIKGHVTGKDGIRRLVVIPGLVDRRAEERALFLKC